MGDFLSFLGNNLIDFWGFTGFANATPEHLVMLLGGLFFIYLAIAKEFEPMLLIPIGFGILIGTLIAGFIGDKLGEKKTFVYSLLLSLFFLFPVFYLPENNVLALGALLFFLLATNLGIAGLVPKYMATFFPAEMRSTGIGFIYNFAAIGGGVSPVIAAALSERVGLGSALVYVTLFWTIVLVSLVGLRLPERIQARMQQ